jgi:hypothetical protein
MRSSHFNSISLKRSIFRRKIDSIRGPLPRSRRSPSVTAMAFEEMREMEEPASKIAARLDT